MPLQATSGAASQDAFGGNGVAVVPTYIEEVFSTYLYTGNGTSQTITNNIDVSTKGGLVWLKSRSNAQYHGLWDTLRGPTHALNSALTDGEYTTTSTQDLTGFTSSGFSLGTYWNNSSNQNGATYASWTFRKQPKFFDIVTYTGNKASGRSIAHNLGSTPGCIIIKSATDTEGWTVYHRSLTAVGYYLNLSATSAESDLANGISSVTDSSFTIGSNDRINSTGQTFVAYIFAHNAGGFGLTGTDNVISCGSYTGNNTSLQSINLGYEPQWILIKSASIAGTEWAMLDNMRGVATGGVDAVLNPNTSGAEASPFDRVDFTSTGFNLKTSSSIYNETGTYIYIAIRRGPMKVPTTGTSVYNAIARTGTGAAATITGVGFAPDWWHCFRKTGSLDHPIVDRLRGSDKGLYSNLLQAEDSLGGNPTFSVTMDGVSLLTLTGGYYNGSGSPYINHFFKRAPSYFDICCYTGSGSATTQTHNLGAVPELIIVKRRNTSGAWDCYSAFLANTDYLALSSANGSQTNTDRWNSTSPTSTVFTVGTSTTTNASGSTYVAYLFATAAGVSKCFSYTGNGSSQTINCGFTSSARFILIKRTDSTGDWYCWDTTRGIAAGNDPHISFNTTAAEVTTDDTIDTDSTGFVVNQLSATDVNVSSATYIGLAIA